VEIPYRSRLVEHHLLNAAYQGIKDYIRGVIAHFSSLFRGSCLISDSVRPLPQKHSSADQMT